MNRDNQHNINIIQAIEQCDKLYMQRGIYYAIVNHRAFTCITDGELIKKVVFHRGFTKNK